MSRRRQRVPLAPDSDDDEIIRASAPASLHDPVSRAAHPERRSRMFSVEESRQWRRERLPFGLPDFFTGIGPFLAAFFPGAHADSPLPRSLVERMQLMRPEVSSADKQHLIDATTIVCTHTSADELQCGICLQSLDQGAQLRMAQCCHKFHDDCLTEWFKSHLDCPQCRVKLSEMMDSMNSVESGSKFSSCSHAALPRARGSARSERVVPERQVSSASSSVSGGSSSNSSSGSSVGRQHRSFFVARGPPDEHLPVAVEHRWPEALSNGGLHFSGIRGPGSFVASARNLGQQGGGSAANDPIIIDDPSPSSACSMQGGLQVVVLSDDSD